MLMKRSIFAKLLGLVLMLLVLAVAGCAAAEEMLAQDSVELYADGGMAAPMQARFGVGTFEDYIVRQLLAGTTRIDLKTFDLLYTEFKPMYQDVLNKHPELFNVDSGYSYYYPTGDPTRITALVPKYKYTGDTLAHMNAVYSEGIAAILDYASSADTTVGKLLRINDYMCANYAYDVRVYSTDSAVKAETIYSPELFFDQGTGVCQAYMLVLRAVLNELDIPSTTVTSSAMNHTWNLVYLEDSDAWYHVDVTWNDALTNKTDMPLRALHKYFLLSDSGITKASHRDWVTTEKATSTKYDSYFWTYLKYPAPMLGDVVYYADDSNGTFYPMLCTFDLETGKRTELFTYKLGSGSAYPGNHPVWASDSLVYYVIRDKLYAAKPDGTSSTVVYETGDTENWIFQIYQVGNSLKLHVTDDPNFPGTVQTYQMADVTFADTYADTIVGETFGINATFDSAEWSSSNTAVATVDKDGVVKAVGVGMAVITASVDETTSHSLTVAVHSKSPMILPDSTLVIAASAFSGIAAEEIVLTEGTLSVGSGAFANCDALKLITLPKSLISISSDAFSGTENAALICDGEKAETFAKSTGLTYAVRPAE